MNKLLTRICTGNALAELGLKLGLTNEDFEVFNQVSNKEPAKPLS